MFEKDTISKEQKKFFDAIKKVAMKQKNVKRISSHMAVIKFSDLINKPWSVSYQLWTASADALISFLQNQDPCEYKAIIKGTLRKAKNGVVTIKGNNKSVVLSENFLDNVLKAIENIKTSKDFVNRVYAVMSHESLDLFKYSSYVYKIFKTKKTAERYKNELEKNGNKHTKFEVVAFEVE